MLHQLTLPAEGTATSAAVILVFKPETLHVQQCQHQSALHAAQVPA